MKNKHYQIIMGLAAGLIVLGGLAYLGKPRAGSPSNPAAGRVSGATATASGLTAIESAYDFGAISMAAGRVSRTFTVKNTSAAPIAAVKLYTSCMCTTASLWRGGQKFGPFGMPGHGSIPRINESIAPGEEAKIEVVFDPAAHGPAGVGRVERAVYLENQNAPLLQLQISAIVTP